MGRRCAGRATAWGMPGEPASSVRVSARTRRQFSASHSAARLPCPPPRRCVRPDESSMTTRCHYLVDGSAVFAITIRRAGAHGRHNCYLLVPGFRYQAAEPATPAMGRATRLATGRVCSPCCPPSAHLFTAPHALRPALIISCRRILHPCWYPAQVLPGGDGSGAVRQAGAVGVRGEAPPTYPPHPSPHTHTQGR